MTNTHLLTGLLLGCTVALTACTADEARHRQDDTYDISERVTALVVTVGGGDVVVTASDRDSIRVVRTLHWRGSEDGRPHAEHAVSGDRLELRGACTGERNGCAVDYRVEVPRYLRVSIDTEAGDLAVHNLAGQLTAFTGAGDVRADGLAGHGVQVNSGSGDVELAFVSGDITLRLPGGPYRVTARTEAGDQIVDVPTDSTATRTVTARSGAGDVRLLPA
jgi:hypothetical protein